MAKAKKDKAPKANGSGENVNGVNERMYAHRQHEFGKFLPPMSDDQYNDLVADIKDGGLRDKIWMFRGEVLEGWHRYRALCESGITLEKDHVEHFKGTDGQALQFVISKNLMRRHLTGDQRSQILSNIRAKLKEQGIVPPGDAEETTRKVADAVGISKSVVNRTDHIAKNAIPEVNKAVVEGEIGSKDGDAISKLDPKQQKAALKKATNPEPNTQPTIRADVIYTSTYSVSLRNADPPAKKDATWFYRTKPEDLQAAIDIIKSQSFEIISFMTVTSKEKYDDPYTDGTKDLILIATKGDPSPPELKGKFDSVMTEQKFVENFGKAYPDAKTSRATFFGAKPTANWQDWKGGK